MGRFSLQRKTSFKRNKKGQGFENPMFVYVGVVAALIFMAPVYLKLVTNIQGPISGQLGNMSIAGAVEAQTNWNAVITPFVTMWDKVMIFAFVVTTLTLFVSAFFIDSHPVWMIMYIISNMILVIFMPGFIAAADNIYESSLFQSEVAYLPFMDSLRAHYMAWMVGIMVIGGIIIYGKVSLVSQGNNPRGGSFR